MVYAFSLPTKVDKVRAGRDWPHEVKYDKEHPHGKTSHRSDR